MTSELDDAPAGSPPPGRRRSWRRYALFGSAALVVLLVVYYLACFWYVWSTGRSDQARPVDAIVVLGAAQYDGRPSPQLAARLDHALELYERGLSARIVVTGGKRPGDRFTEAAASADYLQDRGVPGEAILREAQGSSSWESLEATARILRARGLSSVLLVSDPYHSARIRGIADELGLDAFVSPTRSSPVTGAAALRRTAKEAAGVAVANVIGYRRLLARLG